MSAPRKHHLVAQLYQRGFARQKGKTWQTVVFSLATGERGLRNVKDVFAQRDWNTVTDADGNRYFEVEQMLADRIDSPAAPALAALRRGEFPLTPWHRAALARFMAAQLTRGRAIRENLTEFIIDTTRSMVSMAAANYTDEQWLEVLGKVPSEQERAQLVNSEEHFDIRPTNAMLLNALLGPVEQVADIIYKRTWTLVRFPEPCLFSGENPVIHINPSGDSTGYGVATAEQLYMPVSTTHALLLSHPWTSWPEARVKGSRELATRLNWAMYTYPPNTELLLHPDVEDHPLPGPGVLATGNPRWPWGEDPEADPLV